jgi:hypothetical protein
VLHLARDRHSSENSGANMSSALSSMADVRSRAVQAQRERGREREGAEEDDEGALALLHLGHRT